VSARSSKRPEGLHNTCLGWASWSNFISDEDYKFKGYTSLYYAAHMINLEWVEHRSGMHFMFPSSSDIPDSEGNVLVTSYALRRPDGNWSLMLVSSRHKESRVEFPRLLPSHGQGHDFALRIDEQPQ
jgi:hypothetical protein